jgi:hypothetical protein
MLGDLECCDSVANTNWHGANTHWLADFVKSLDKRRNWRIGIFRRSASSFSFVTLQDDPNITGRSP